MKYDILELKEFDRPVRAAYSLLLLSKTPSGFLSILPDFVHALEKDKKHKEVYKAVKESMNRKAEILNRHKQALVNWMIDRLTELKKLKCSKDSIVKKAIANAEAVLSGECYEISSGGYFSVLTYYFEEACRAVARYGVDPCFEKWIEVTNKEHIITFLEVVLKDPVFNKEIKPTTSEGRKIIHRLQHGFHRAYVEDGAQYFAEDPRYVIEWGEVEKVMYPDEWHIWRQSADIKRSQVQLDISAEDNLSFLLHLSLFKDLVPVALAGLPRSTSIFEAEAICNQQLLQYYLSGFRGQDWSKTPLSREDILMMLNRLFVLLQDPAFIGEKNLRGRHGKKEEAREFVARILEDIWEKFKADGTPLTTYQPLRYAVFCARQEAPHDIQNATTNTLIEEEITKFAKRKNIKTVRGKAKKKGSAV